MKKLLTITLLFSCITGLTANEFPLCLYGVNNPADLKLIKKAGFSCVQTYQTDPDKLEALAKEAKKLGLKVVFYPTKILGTSAEQKAQKWPILAWYLVDEPDIHKTWTREKVKEANGATKNAFPQHATTLVISQGKTPIPYYDLTDSIMVDWYPVPHLLLTSFGDNVRFTQEGLTQTHATGHPLWGVVQIFDWKNFKQYRPDNDRIGRFPTAAEIRFMAYDGILNGATGLFFYTFKHLKQPLPQSAPQHWVQVTQVTQELAKFKKILEKGLAVKNPIEIKEPLVLKTWQYKRNLYIILLNRSADPQPVPADLLQRDYKPMYQTQKSTDISPYDVWILKKELS
ncbi:MAG: hypothetical protein J6X06_04240 [Elusimicrobiaceae bacterium]|nr:hypothetical protein [Elusimicrobiaceae bacterium]